MLSIQFIEPSNPILNQVSEEVTQEELAEPFFQKFIDEMFVMARGEQGDPNSSVLVGLAAPQVGVSKRVILVVQKADGKGKVSDLAAYINPKILECSDEEEIWYEGCYSTGHVTGVVSRPKTIKIEALDRTGKKLTETHFGFIARIFQHEIDHLNGIRFPDHIENEEDLHIVEDDQFPLYRNNEAWRSWPHKCSKEHWSEITNQ